jgi:hypothetical protein
MHAHDIPFFTQLNNVLFNSMKKMLIFGHGIQLFIPSPNRIPTQSIPKSVASLFAVGDPSIPTSVASKFGPYP